MIVTERTIAKIRLRCSGIPALASFIPRQPVADRASSREWPVPDRPQDPAPDRSRSRPTDDSARCGAVRASCRRARRAARPPRARTPSSSGGSDSRVRPAAPAADDRGGSARSRARPTSAGRTATPVCRIVPFRTGRDPRECGAEVGEQTLEWACQDRRPCYDDVIVPGPRRTRQQRASRCDQAPPGAIARDRLADPPARREADPDLTVVAPAGRGPAWSTNAGVTQRRRVAATATNSARRLRRATRGRGAGSAAAKA